MSHSSPVKSGGPLYAPQLRADVQSFAVPNEFEDLSLADFWKVLDYRPEDFKDSYLSDHWDPKDDFGEYMNEISRTIFNNLGAYLLNH
jgi:hypothetical protein